MGKVQLKIAAKKAMTPPAVSVDQLPPEMLNKITVTKGDYQGPAGVYVTGATYIGLESHAHYAPGEKKHLEHCVTHQTGHDGYPVGGTRVKIRPKF